METMHILLLCPYPPYPPRSGGALRIYNLLVGLAQRHTVWCLTFAQDAAAVAALDPLRTHCHVIAVRGVPSRSLAQRAWTTLRSPLPDMALRNASSAYTAALRQLLATQSFDVIQAESIEMAQYGLEVRGQGTSTTQPRNTRIILDQFNAEYVLQRRAALTDIRRPRALIPAVYSLIQWRKLAAYERRLLREYDHVLVVSEEDRQALARLRPAERMSIVPNGVDTTFFDRQAVPRDQPAHQQASIVFTGTLDFRPNIDAVLWFAREVLPLVRAKQPAARFVVVGRSPAPAVQALHDGDAVEIVGEVADVRPFIANAGAYVVPMRIGGGVRLKLLEALAMQAPVVSTAMGAEGVPQLCAGEHLLLADTPAAFAEAILRVLLDPHLAKRLGTQGRHLVQQHYDWQVIVPRLEAVYGE